MIKQPNSRMCFVCGLENPRGLRVAFYNEDGEVRARHTVPQEHQGYPGVAHGGIVSALLDELGARTAMMDSPDRFMMTARIEVRFRKPVPVDVALDLIGRPLVARGKYVTAHAEVRLPDGAVAAEAVVTLVELPSGVLENMGPPEILGWRVYPDDPAA